MGMRDDIERQIRAANAGRDPTLRARKYAAMANDVFAFLRGTCHLFYARMPIARVTRSAPAAWACGDLHLANFGSYRGDNHLVYFDLNDFDEACLASCTWDLLRLSASVLVGRKALAVGAKDARSLCESLVAAYADAIAEGKARWLEREAATGAVRELLYGLRARKRPKHLDRYTEVSRGQRKLVADGAHALPADRAQARLLRSFMAAFAKTQDNPRFFRVLDVARRVAGTGSLGLERYVLLVHGHGSPDGNFLLDLKEAARSSVAARTGLHQPRWPSEAHRVAAVQRRVQAISVAFLHPVVLEHKSFVLRALQPTQDRVDLTRVAGDAARLQQLMISLGRLAAWGQLRSSGRQGSATADELIRYWSKPRRSRKLLAFATQCAERVEEDWEAYRHTYAAGRLK
jgi:uncharacterized protein (DUF2252 family)